MLQVCCSPQNIKVCNARTRARNRLVARLKRLESLQGMKSVSENSTRERRDGGIEAVQGLKPSIYRIFPARLEVVPCYMSRWRMQDFSRRTPSSGWCLSAFSARLEVMTCYLSRRSTQDARCYTRSKAQCFMRLSARLSRAVSQGCWMKEAGSHA
jgi:hypothetical protein